MEMVMKKQNKQKNKKIKKVMHEFEEGALHSGTRTSGSKKGPEVTNPKQALAIAISESKKKHRKGK
jgi:hypothetical protein